MPSKSSAIDIHSFHLGSEDPDFLQNNEFRENSPRNRALRLIAEQGLLIPQLIDDFESVADILYASEKLLKKDDFKRGVAKYAARRNLARSIKELLPNVSGTRGLVRKESARISIKNIGLQTSRSIQTLMIEDNSGPQKVIIFSMIAPSNPSDFGEAILRYINKLRNITGTQPEKAKIFAHIPPEHNQRKDYFAQFHFTKNGKVSITRMMSKPSLIDEALLDNMPSIMMQVSDLSQFNDISAKEAEKAVSRVSLQNARILQRSLSQKTIKPPASSGHTPTV